MPQFSKRLNHLSVGQDVDQSLEERMIQIVAKLNKKDDSQTDHIDSVQKHHPDHNNNSSEQPNKPEREATSSSSGGIPTIITTPSSPEVPEPKPRRPLMGSREDKTKKPKKRRPEKGEPIKKLRILNFNSVKRDTKDRKKDKSASLERPIGGSVIQRLSPRRDNISSNNKPATQGSANRRKSNSLSVTDPANPRSPGEAMLTPLNLSPGSLDSKNDEISSFGKASHSNEDLSQFTDPSFEHTPPETPKTARPATAEKKAKKKKKKVHSLDRKTKKKKKQPRSATVSATSIPAIQPEARPERPASPSSELSDDSGDDGGPSAESLLKKYFED